MGYDEFFESLERRNSERLIMIKIKEHIYLSSIEEVIIKRVPEHVKYLTVEQAFEKGKRILIDDTDEN
jgi:hypothetical protein